jgi:hypothetical protein
MLAADDTKLVNEAFVQGPQIGIGIDHHLTIRAVKILADGGLGARSAALLHPYHDDPGNNGILRVSEGEIFSLVKRALNAGFQVAVHGVGDRTNRTVLNACERALTENPKPDTRLRIEHLSVVDPEDIPRIAKLGMVVAIQPLFCRTQCSYVGERVGPELAREGAFAWRSLLNAGIRIVGSSDSPVENMNPLLGIYTAVTRQDANGLPPEGWYPNQKLTLREAVAMYTREAAFATFDEKAKGTIEVGKNADFTVLSANPFTDGVGSLLLAHADLTIIGGEIAFQRH